MQHTRIRLLKTVLVIALAAAAAPARGAENYCLLQDGPATAEWREVYVNDGITVYAQKQPTTGIIAFRARGVIDAPMEQVMEVLRKVEISEDWMPDISEKYTLKNISDYEAITYSVNELPWPLADREMILRNALRLDPRRKFIVVDVYSEEEAAPPLSGENVRAYMHCGRTRLRPADANRTEMDLVLYVDPRGYIPTWMANLVQKRMPYTFLKALEAKAGTTTYTLRPSFQKILDELRALM
jgi:hypothetical protein